jgi:hypothetical protein
MSIARIITASSRRVTANRLSLAELRDFLPQIRTGAVLFLHLFYGTNSPAKIGNFCEFLLDCFQPLMPLAVSNLSLRVISAAAPPVLVVQLLQFCNLGA